MGLNIINQEAEKIAIQLARTSGHSVEEEVLVALRERAERLGAKFDAKLYQDLKAISEKSAKLPVIDKRTPEEILYDKNGLPE